MGIMSVRSTNLFRFSFVRGLFALIVLTGCSKATQLAETLEAQGLSIATSSLTPAIENQYFQENLTASGGEIPYTFSIISGTLPAGLSMNSSGDITGTTAVTGTTALTFMVTDLNGSVATRTLNLRVAQPLIITTATLDAAEVNVVYSESVVATGGTPPYTFSATGFPTGYSISTTGIISGTSSSTADVIVAITVTDSAGLQDTKNFSFSVTSPPSITTASLSNAIAGSAYSVTLATTGGETPYVYSITSGSLPAGLSLSSAGVISGTPSFGANVKQGTFSSINILVTDAIGQTDTKAFAINVYLRPVVLKDTSKQLRRARQGVAYLDNIEAWGGVGALNYQVYSGSLPTGLSLNSTSGYISGAPTASGTYNVFFTVTDALGLTSDPVEKQLIVGASSWSTIDIGALQVPIGRYNANWAYIDDFDIADMNNDGKQDMITGARDSRGILISTGDGNGNFTKTFHLSAGSTRPRFLSVSDIDNDGHKDVVVATQDSTIEVWYGDSNWTSVVPVARRRSITIATSNLYGLYLTDLNNDNKIDILTGDWQNNNVRVIFNCTSSANVLINAVSTPCNSASGGNNFHVTTIAVGSNPRDVIAHDFDGDGDKDIVATLFNPNTISIINANNNLGSFAAPRTQTAGSLNPRGIEKADMNGDGLMDLVITGDYSISVLLRDPVATPFAFNPQAVAIDDLGVNSEFIDIADIDGDSNPDVVFTAGNTYRRNIGILYNTNGNGILQNRQDFSGGYQIYGVKLKPMFTSSTRPDLVIANTSWVGLSRMQIYPNRNVTVAGTTPYSFGEHYMNSAPDSYVQSFGQQTVGDIDNDGDADIMVKIGGAANMTMNNGDGTFTVNPNLVSTGDLAANWWFGRQILLADLNGDGNLDMLSANYNGGGRGTTTAVLGNGDGSWGTQFTFYSTPSNGCVTTVGARSIDVGDFNRDGKIDVVVGTGCGSGAPGGQAFVYLGYGDGTFNTTAWATLNASGTNHVDQVRTVDFNYDGYKDVVLIGNSTGRVYLHTNSSGTGFTHNAVNQYRNIAMQSGISALDIGDANNDGYIDYVLASYNSGAPATLGVAFGAASGQLSVGTSTLTGLITAEYQNQSQPGMILADMNGDGYLDILGMRAFNNGTNVNGGGGLHLYLGNGTGTFTNPTFVYAQACYGPYSDGHLTKFDFNNDGKMDFVNTLSDGGSGRGTGINWNRSN